MSRVVVAVVVAVAVAALAGSCLPRQSIAPFSFVDANEILGLDVVAPAGRAGALDSGEGHGAVILLDEQRFLFQRLHEYSGQVHSELFTHEVIKLESEAGFENARVEIAWPKDGTLVQLDARTIAADGTVTPLSQAELFASEVKLAKDMQIDARVFEFPRVEVGSILELAYKIDLPGLYTQWNERIPHELPIRSYKVDVAVDAVAQPAMRVMNAGDVQPTETTDAAGMKHVSFAMANIPPRTSESYAPRWRTREPWWVFHTILYKYRPNEIWYTHYDWDDEVKRLALSKKEKELDGTPDIDVARCNSDPQCVLKVALDKTNELTVFDDFDAFAFERDPVKEIITRGKAGAGNKAFLYAAILLKAGVDARLAGVQRVGTAGAVDKGFPTLLWLDHTIVLAIFGQQAFWVDPSCEACRPGYLPPWDPIGVGDEGLKTKETLVVNKLDAPESQWWSLMAQPETAVDNVELSRFTVDIGDDGSAHVAEDDVRTGLAASLWRGDTVDEDDDDRRRAAYAGLSSIARGAVVEKATPLSCDAARSRCERHIEATLPKYAWRAAGEVVVPLDLLGTAWRIDDDRKQDVVSGAYRARTELAIKVPAGMTIASMPAARQASAGIVEVATTIEKTAAGAAPTTAPTTATITSELRMKPGRVAKKDLAPVAHALDVRAGAATGVVRFTTTTATTTTTTP